MKKILLLALAAFALLAACSKNDDKPNDVLKTKLIGEWEEYGYYWINKGGGNRPDDTTYYPNQEEIKYWTFRSDNTYDGNGFKNKPYHIKNDSLVLRNEERRHIEFAGDSCILTTDWFGTHNHAKFIYFGSISASSKISSTLVNPPLYLSILFM